MSDQSGQIIQVGFGDDDMMEEEPVFQETVYENDIEREGTVGGAMEIPTELIDPMRQVMAKMELGLEAMGSKIDKGQAESKAEMKAMGEDLRYDTKAMGR